MSDDDCIDRFRDFLQSVWMDNTSDEALQQWQQRVLEFPTAAASDLECLESILADPPENLVQMLHDDGWVILTHRPDPQTVVGYTHDEYVEWLRDMTARFRDAYRRASAS